ncbi:SusE domain-containing protein [Anaerorudis cellulosivorans]|uniref:SusE domain-containing protein n=1 Tax=Anaerorudis cellulosivorans TaxID=3397862 RepID=UPI00221F1086|nr:SusE domain-containing protein [Seramator thermalis]MCW1734437.1 SusE domain-containing protein [Seramator thermalis]
MNKIDINLSIIVTLISLIFVSCNDSMGDPDTRLSEVKTLIEPADGKTITLEPSASASVYFEWDYVKAEESGTAIYQIAFDTQEGDFSNPVYVMYADNNGYYNHVTITHKLLNKIAGMADIMPSETGTLKWTVFSIKGTKIMKASQSNSLTITRLSGFADLPIDVYITGEASEGGTDLAHAQKMKVVSNGTFEVYTQVLANKPFYFTDGITGTPRQFYTSNGLVKENGTTTLSNGGVYRIILDFNTGAATYTLVEKIGFFFCPSNAVLFELPYIGNGIFKATKQTVTFKQESWGRDQRYKFRMFVRENGGQGDSEELEWGTLNQTDSPPTATSPESYYHMQLVTPTQWDNKWKLMGDFDGVPADYTVYLQADKPYTHSICK